MKSRQVSKDDSKMDDSPPQEEGMSMSLIESELDGLGLQSQRADDTEWSHQEPSGGDHWDRRTSKGADDFLHHRPRAVSFGEDPLTPSDREHHHHRSCHDHNQQRSSRHGEHDQTTSRDLFSLCQSEPSVPTSSEGDAMVSFGRHSADVEDEATGLDFSEAELRADASPPWYINVLYAIINSAIILPVLISFGTIIYHDEFFQPYLSTLIYLTVVSGMVHQLCFSTLSTLPFAVGQVQDAGLIFLSAMATSMVQHCRQLSTEEAPIDDGIILATVTIGLGIATALLGAGLVVLAMLRLAESVQILPTPVIGGYLAFIGYFCGKSGLLLMIVPSGSARGEDATRFNHERSLQPLVLVLPGMLCGLTIYMLVRHIRHTAVLPSCLVVILVGFYAILWITDCTVDEATALGWIRQQSAPPPVWYHTWDYLRFDKVIWSAFPPQILTLLSMIFVVALSSSLDVAAIEMELKRPLNYSHELKMVGTSNIISGLLGGYSGSYIFSQTIFALRAGIRSRLTGYVLALVQLLFVVLPIPILSYVPNIFFGSLLVMICIDLVHEWLWAIREQVNDAEYGICLGTFALIHVVGVEFGILGGVALYFGCRMMGVPLGPNGIAEKDSDDTVAQASEHEQLLVSANIEESKTRTGIQKSYQST